MSKKKVGLFAVVVVALIGGYLAVRAFRDPPPVARVADMDAAISANNRGLGAMESFRYDEAVAAFQSACEKAPDWTAPRINLAIGLLNHEQPKHHDEVARILEEVLAKEPDNPNANYVLGYLWKFRANLDKARPYFDAVVRIDPNDAHSWAFKGWCHPDGDDAPEAIECYKKALRLNPYLNLARHRLFEHARGEERIKLLEEETQLKDAFWEKQSADKYFDMGPYAEVIGRTRQTHPPQPAGPIPPFENWDASVTLAPGATWRTDSTPLQAKLDQRFGRAISLFDYDRDGRTDLMLASAVMEKGQVRDLLLRNVGGGKFVDVTHAAELAKETGTIGVAVADFDNDGHRDLLLTRNNGVRLLRNTGSSKFEDVTAAAGLDKLTGVFLGAGWCDVDQDSDLDLVLCRVGDSVDEAISALDGKAGSGSRVEVWQNTGDARPVPKGQVQPPLSAKFRRVDDLVKVQPSGIIPVVAFSDLDNDLDVDLLLLCDGKPPTAIKNDRLMRFSSGGDLSIKAGSWNGAVVLDVDHDGRSDLLVLRDGQSPNVLLRASSEPGKQANDWYKESSTNSPALRQAQVCDLDADGWADLIALGQDGRLVFLHNNGRDQLEHIKESIILPVETDLLAVASADFDDDCSADVVTWSAGKGLRFIRNLGNGHRSLKLELSGRNEVDSTRTNADGIACKVSAMTGRFWTGMENTSLSSGLGQSRLPITLGMGKHQTAEAVRVLWPDGVPQAELARTTCDAHAIREENRKPVSCPVLLVWNGQRFVYVTDFLGAGSVGESGPDGSVRPPRPEESIKIDPGLLVPRDGKFVIKINEPMDEIMYLDRLQLVAIDHPRGTTVFPDERFATADPQPTQELLVFGDPVFPTKATDHRGLDVTRLIRHQDKQYASGFHRRAWIGYAEEHSVELDFGEQLARSKPGERFFLILNGWTDYAYPESIYAASQAGVSPQWPVLERMGPDGKWTSIGDLGFPAGLTRTMTREVSKDILGPSCRLRIRTNLHIHWDQISIAPLKEIATNKSSGTSVVELAPEKATFAHRGILQEIRPNGPNGPIEYDSARTEVVAMTPWKGMLTRFGDVTQLLTRDDDCFVVGGPGDELTVTFDASKLSPPAEGMERSFVLRTWGYCKDSSPTTLTSGQVGPLPFRAKSPYPNFSAEDKRLADQAQLEYQRRWNIRPAAGGK